MKIFVSFKFDSEEEFLVRRVHFYLQKQPGVQPYFWPEDRRAGGWRDQLRRAIRSHDAIVFFWGRQIGETQRLEARYGANEKKTIVPVKLPNNFDPDALDHLDILTEQAQVVVSELGENAALACAKDIVQLLGLDWVSIDGLPLGYPFEYEKHIIKEFIDGQGELSLERVQEGCPRRWPVLRPANGITRDNPVGEGEIGSYRDYDTQNEVTRDPQVIPAALSEFHNSECLMHHGLTFPEAGPRKLHLFPRENTNNLNAGVIVSGGIAPGINAVITGLIKRLARYAEEGKFDLTVLGYPEGFKPLTRAQNAPNMPDRRQLFPTAQGNAVDELAFHADRGGSLLPTSRTDILTAFDDPDGRETAFNRIISRLDHDSIDILYVIGGDGSMKAARALAMYAKKAGNKVSICGIPKTMDNDILWVWQSFGFLSAVEWAKGAIRQLYREATSNPRLCVIQLFGSDSGFVVSHAALASGVCDLVLIPEVPFSMKKITSYIKGKLSGRLNVGSNGQSPFGIILMAENAIPQDAAAHINLPELELTEKEKRAILDFDRNGRRVHGQTPDDLRHAGLKIVTGMLQKSINRMQNPYWRNFRVFSNEPRHLIRSIPPSSSDIIAGERLGSLAVDCAMGGYTDFMISQWLTEYVMVPLELVVLGRKRIPRDGIFWKSVIAKTGQPADIT